MSPANGARNFDSATEDQSMIMVRHIKLLSSPTLYAFTSLSPSKAINTGITNAANPKHLDIKKYAAKAPSEPQLL